MLTIVALVLAAVLAQAGPPPTTPPGMPEGLAFAQAKDWTHAAEVMRVVTQREPKNALAFRVLALSLIRLGRYDDALGVLATARELDPNSGPAIYNTAVAYALSGKKSEAIAWLRNAKTSRRVDITQAMTDNDPVSLRDDPDFLALQPKPEDFANPFVEDVKVIREWDGEHAEDQFGWIARPIGDVDGDRVPDFVTSAPTSSAGGTNAGRIYVYSTKSGALLWKADGQAEDQLGTGVEAAGDTNKDGIPDVVAAGPGHSKAFVYSGKDGAVLFAMRGEKEDDEFGNHASGCGDVDGDGYADVIIGAPGNDAAGADAGRAYVYSGKDGHVLFVFTGERAGDRFGSTVAGASNGKQRFLLVGAPKSGAKQTGRTYVYDGSSAKPTSAKPKFVIDSDDTGNALGAMFLSVLGDVNGDGVADVYASDWSNAAKGPSTGRVYVHSGADGSRLMTLTGETQGEGFGTCPAKAGDVDGDGRADLVVGAWQYGVAAVSGGRVCLYSGRDGHRMRTYTCRTPGDTFGFDAQGMGDVDHDGTVDFLITSGWSGIHGHHSGRIFVISSGVKAKRR
jgi:hypothetical protein